MLNVIGFWFSVSVITIALVFPIFLVLLGVVKMAISKALPVDVAYRLRSGIARTSRDDGIILFDRVFVHNGFLLCTFTGGAILWFCVFMGYMDIGYSILDSVIAFSRFCAPIAGYVGILVGLYFLLIAGIKLAYKGSLFIAKVNAHVDNKGIHNGD